MTVFLKCPSFNNPLFDRHRKLCHRLDSPLPFAAQVTTIDMAEKELELTKEANDVIARKGYTIGKYLAKGAFGFVYRGYNKAGVEIALKMMDLQAAREKSDTMDKFFRREVDALREIVHPHVVRIFDMIEMDKKLFTFMEVCTLQSSLLIT